MPVPSAAKPTLSEPAVRRFFRMLSNHLAADVCRSVPLAGFTTLRVGGPASLYYDARDADAMGAVICAAQHASIPYFILGGGSNVCISDRGVKGLVIHNRCRQAALSSISIVDCGYPLWTLFQRSARLGLGGLEFAVGIPGSLGGALVSNAGAYRQNISDIVKSIDVVEGGERVTVGPEWMEFSYRDSRIRRPGPSVSALLRVSLELKPTPRRKILERARENQRQRIFKQPWLPSAGSFFKNVMNRELADQLPNLPLALKDAGVVPAGYLSAACNCKGLRVGGAQISSRHGNFVVNRGDATAQDIRSLTSMVKERVFNRFGFYLQEEVLFVGDWPEGDWRVLASAIS